MANSLQIEGLDDNQRTGLLQILIPPAEAIQTVSVSTSNQDRELGRGTGAIANLVMRSGTNRFNGAVYEFIQNSVWAHGPSSIPQWATWLTTSSR